MNRGQYITQEPLTFDDILNRIPCVSIREYIPDSRLNQAWNLFTSLLTPIMKLGKTIAKSGEMMSMIEYALKYICGMTEPSMWNDPLGKDSSYEKERRYPFSSYDLGRLEANGISKDHLNYVMKFPYWMYYLLQTCTTTNIYDIPAISDDKKIISSNGQAGWSENGDLDIFGKKIFGIDTGIVGKLIGHVGVNFLPFWDASSARHAGGD